MRDSRKLEEPSPVIAGRCRIQGNLETHREAMQVGKIRGNPEIYHRHRQRMRESRKLEEPSPAQPEDAGSEETRSLISKAERDDARSECPASSYY